MKQYNSIIGSQKFILSDVDSTNNFAAKLIDDGIECHGSVILAENQSNGRGQQGSIWQSESKSNLLCSIVLCSEDISNLNPIYINWFVSVCIVDFLKSKKIDALIKWPNDILIGKQKIAGILIENKFLGVKLKQSIAGVGINVNQQSFDRLLATSMTLQTGMNYSIVDLFDEFIFYLKQNEKLLFIDQEDQLKKKYLNDLFGLGEELVFTDNTGVFNGVIVGVDQSGQLLVESKGKIDSFQNKEVRFL